MILLKKKLLLTRLTVGRWTATSTDQSPWICQLSATATDTQTCRHPSPERCSGQTRLWDANAVERFKICRVCSQCELSDEINCLQSRWMQNLESEIQKKEAVHGKVLKTIERCKTLALWKNVVHNLCTLLTKKSSSHPWLDEWRGYLRLRASGINLTLPAWQTRSQLATKHTAWHAQDVKISFNFWFSHLKLSE